MGLKKTLNNLFGGSKEESDCMKMLDVLESILDMEAGDSQKEKFHDHIEKCMPCYEKYNLDKSIKELVKMRCNNTQIPSGLVDSIKLQVSQSDRN